MTTETQPRFVQPAAGRKPSTGALLAIVAGSVLALAGTGFAVAGGGLFALFGGDDTVSSGTHSLSTPSAALVSEVADIEDTAEVADVLGDPRVRVSVEATGSAPGVFVGIGPADQVDRYLASAPIEEVTDVELDPFVLERRARGGNELPARPASQRFWVAQGTGPDAASLRWKVRDGDYRLVVMNADGSRAVDTEGDLGVTIPHLPAIAWSLIGAGLLLMIGGGAAIALGVVSTRRNELSPGSTPELG